MNPKNQRRWVTDAHRKLADAERARYQWLIETSQWHVNGDPEPGHLFTSTKRRWVIAVVILLLMQLMLQRSTIEWSAVDETIGIEQNER